MANSNAPFGMSPVSYLNGATWNGQARMYYIASTDNNAFAIGDPVKSSGTGDGNGVAGVTLGTAGSALRGIIVGMGSTVYGGPGGDPASPQVTVIPATKTKAYYVMVVDDPNVIFRCQEDSDSAALAATDIGENANLIAGTNNGYVSGWLIDSSSHNTTSTLMSSSFKSPSLGTRLTPLVTMPCGTCLSIITNCALAPTACNERRLTCLLA